jgi:hypothetical protein
MATRTRTANASLFRDRINILNKNALEASPARQIFKTASAILALVRVSVLPPRPSADSRSHSWPNQDKKIDDAAFVQVSEYCFSVCKVLETTIQRRDADDIAGLERCVD